MFSTHLESNEVEFVFKRSDIARTFKDKQNSKKKTNRPCDTKSVKESIVEEM